MLIWLGEPMARRDPGVFGIYFITRVLSPLFPKLLMRIITGCGFAHNRRVILVCRLPALAVPCSRSPGCVNLSPLVVEPNRALSAIPFRPLLTMTPAYLHRRQPWTVIRD